MNKETTLHEALIELSMMSLEGLARAYSSGNEERIERKQKDGAGAYRVLVGGFAKKIPPIAEVVEGNATFHSYGEPIIDHVKKVEDRYKGKKFGYISKEMLLGEDGSFDTSPGAREAVQFLREARIIDPDGFFCSTFTYPGESTIYNLDRHHPGKTVLGITSGSLALGAATGYLGYEKAGEVGAMIGGSAAFLSSFLLALSPFHPSGYGIKGITQRRQKFEEALNDLDSTIRRHYPLEN